MSRRSTSDFTMKDARHPCLSTLFHCFRESWGFFCGVVVVVLGIVISAGTTNIPCWRTSGVSAGFWMSSSLERGGTLRSNWSSGLMHAL